MVDIIQELIDDGMCNVIDSRLSVFLDGDMEYDRLEKEVDELEQKYSKLDINTDDRELIDEYIQANELLKDYMYERTYFAGVKDTIALLSKMGLINNIS